MCEEVIDPLTQELKDRWLAALRSGKYAKGTSQLCSSNNKFCCLGVICDVIDSSKWRDTIGEFKLYQYSNDVKFAFGLGKPDELPYVLPFTVQQKLADLNYVFSFNEIADWIEENIMVEV